MRHLRARWLAAAVGVGLAFAGPVAAHAAPPRTQPAPTIVTPSAVPLVGHARHAGDDYPYATLGQFGQSGPTDPWNEFYGQCDSFAAWKVYENLGGTGRVPQAEIPVAGFAPADAAVSPVWGTAIPTTRTNWGDARDWRTAALAAGYAVDNTPHPGSIAWWDDSGPFTEFGHVGYVTDVYTDGSVTIESYNQRGNGQYSTLHMGRSGADDTSFHYPTFRVPWPTGFVHIGDGPASIVQPPQPAPAVAFHYPHNVYGPGDGGSFSLAATTTSGTDHGWRTWSGGGEIGTMRWTTTNGSNADSAATWNPALQPSRCYTLDAFVPDNHSDAPNARYTITDLTTGTSVHTVDENAYTNQWAALGTFRARTDGTIAVILTDQAPIGLFVAADGIRFRQLPNCPAATHR